MLVVLGTRPEAVKLAPVIVELRKQSAFQAVVCNTAQHREMLEPFLDVFGIEPDFDLNVMTPNQTLFHITNKVLLGMATVLTEVQPEVVLVQGDTTTAFAAALAAFYVKVRVGHVEAGLRTEDKYNPFPEEINRRLVSHLADIHFAPTKRAKTNLLHEGIPHERIIVTGNTIVDALLMTLKRTRGTDSLPKLPLDSARKLILVTAHRRESFGHGLENICRALKEIAARAASRVVSVVGGGSRFRAGCEFARDSSGQRIALAVPGAGCRKSFFGRLLRFSTGP